MYKIIFNFQKIFLKRTKCSQTTEKYRLYCSIYKFKFNLYKSIKKNIKHRPTANSDHLPLVLQ